MYFKILLWTLLVVLPTTSARAHNYRYSDVHLHYVDFFQESAGITKLLEGVDSARIDHAVFTGISVAKEWDENEPVQPRYYAGDDAKAYWYSATDTLIAHAYKQLPAEVKPRFHPFISGFNPNDMNAAAQIKDMLDRDPGLWQGIGEVFTRHDYLTALIYGKAPRANSKALAKVYQVAADYDLPVLLHSNITSKRERYPLYLGEFEEALRANPDTRFIWAHAGTSMEIYRTQGKMTFLLPTIEQLLGKYPNLYVDLSWSVLHPYLVDELGNPDPAWVNMVSRYPTRFMLGSDVVGTFGSLSKYMFGFEPFLDALPHDTAHRVALSNLISILPAARQKKISAAGFLTIENE
ncbi:MULTISPECIES: amidohydrolase family protein [Aeromonas]|uniref:amidohydrolase family protein n=1 Tax=Aeromonas TaxID=642 RepID=UPI001C237D0C|nr:MULTISPECIES: amidohydrolase family protein [Aeromonas]MDX7771199.1 amidohydrolase family protein [Aeromonas caviae]QWZ54735.1 amidohydrolase [Aeromonas sp. FDAARGOS 1402]